MRLGELREGGLAPAVAAIVERGVRRRPAHAAAVIAVVELRVQGPYPPVRVTFQGAEITVEDGPASAADIRIEGELTDLISMMVAPTVGGLPSPMNARGRVALGMVASRRVRVRGRVGLMRRLLAIVKT
ncbi:MAG TPA: hypothetical protein VG223_08865 [Solirubrobacteraceae bacterium]|nr:hypothetical protein [Solirubrobacteraceae bacterium]